MSMFIELLLPPHVFQLRLNVSNYVSLSVDRTVEQLAHFYYIKLLLNPNSDPNLNPNPNPNPNLILVDF